jgi:CheY-like chemotaxis protein
MPRMDGFEFIRFLRSDPARRGLPIIVVSADTDPDTPALARLAGADAYFSKPCSPTALRQALEQLLYAHGSQT